MTAKANMQCVILFEDEVRIAAKALAQVYALGDNPTSIQINAAISNALGACQAALNKADDDNAILLLGRKPVVPNDQAKGPGGFSPGPA